MSAFNRVIGYDGLKAELTVVCDAMKNPAKYRSLGVTTPKGILFCGEPGIGKSLMAEVIIEESGRKAFTIRKDRPDGEFVNHIRTVFEQAAAEAPSIVLLDDMDKFANTGHYHRDAEEYVTVQACIDNVKGKDVFVLATANDKHDLPDSLIREGRFDKIIEMEYPEDEDAEKIVWHFLHQRCVDDDVDAVEIAHILDGKSCAALETIVNDAGIFAAYNGRNRISQDDLIRSCLRHAFDAPKSFNDDSNASKLDVAVHEAGHVVVSEILDPGSVNIVSISGYGGNVNGITSVRRPKGYWMSKELMENRVIGILAGKAATEIVLNRIDVGAHGDMKRAFSVVRRFVDEYCSLGFDSFTLSDSSDDILANRDRNVSTEVDRYYREAKRILSSNRDFFDAVVDTLLEKTTITQREICEIRNRFNTPERIAG